MKGLLVILGLVLLRTCNTGPANFAPPTPVSFQQFYDELSPYGTWVDEPNYGYMWVPDVDDDFRPYYTNGNWVATDQGNAWQSDYPWGWAPFHYGNWGYTDPYGWAWVPGYDWAPAHVSWRQGNGFYGWAPLLPGLSISIGLGGYNPPGDWWVFVPQARLYDNNVYRFWPGPQFNPSILPHTTYITNVYKGKWGNNYIYGPRASEYTALTGKNVKVRRMVDVPGFKSAGRKGNDLRVYRPQVKPDKASRPTKVMQDWAGKSQRGGGKMNQKATERGPQQDKALPSTKQPGRKPDAAGDKQRTQPERKPASPGKQQERKAPAKQQQRTAPAKQQQRTSPAKQQQRTAPARKQSKPSAAPQRSSQRPAQKNVRHSAPPAPRKQSAPRQQQRVQQRQPQQKHSAQPAGRQGGGQQPRQQGGQGGGKKK